MPRKTRRSSRRSVRVSRRQMGPRAKRLSDLGVEVEKIQLALCVRSVYERFIKKGSPRGRATLGRAFAICTKSLQKNGYLRVGTATPTKKGVDRSLEMAEMPETKAKLSKYEEILSLAREGRPGRRGGQIVDLTDFAKPKSRSTRKSKKSRRTTRRKAA